MKPHHVVGLVTTFIVCILAIFFLRLDTYTAVVQTPAFLDTDNGKTSKFVRLIPSTNVTVVGRDEKGILKLKVADSWIPYFAWATDGDRAVDLKEGQVICVRERGYRNNLLSSYPIFLWYKDGPCPK